MSLNLEPKPATLQNPLLVFAMKQAQIFLILVSMYSAKQ